MSQGGYTHTTRATGTVLTASIYNADHQNHILNQNPLMTGGYSDNVAQMQLVSDPGSIGAEQLAPHLAGELERIRFQIKAITGESQWYIRPSQAINQIGGLGDGTVPITKLSNTTQGQMLGRVAAGTGPWQEFNIPGLSNLVPAQDDLLIGVPASGGAMRNVKIKDVVGNLNIPPQGRLTLTVSTPVMASTAAAQNTVRYTPYTGLLVPAWNGTNIQPFSMGIELTQLTTDNTKSPAACIANKNYDIFFWMDGSTPRISRGWPWSDDSNRGVGVSTAELTRIAGLLVNAQNITNGPLAQRGTYLGTIRSNASSLVDWIFGGIASGGAMGSLGVWNNYNRVSTYTFVGTSTDFWSYSGTTWRYADNSNTYRVNVLSGFAEDAFDANYNCYVGAISQASQQYGSIGVAVDGTTPSGQQATIIAAGSTAIVAPAAHIPSRHARTVTGWHYFAAVEVAGLGTPTFGGDRGNPANEQGGLHLMGRM